MSIRLWRRRLRQALIEQFLRMLRTEEVRQYLSLENADYGAIRRNVALFPDPYRPNQTSFTSRDADTLPPIFITGRFRSGSTLLWNIFRKMPEYTAYYEPFNERRWFDHQGRGSHIDSTHQGVSEYWSEYGGLEQLGEHYREDWIRERLYMGEHDFDHDMVRYISGLADAAEKRAVLQFNRVDFRLPWLKANFPESPIIHIYRNPRDQWCSTLRDIESYPYQCKTEADFVDRFYLRMWVRDLCQQFPFLNQYQQAHQYYNFYLLWQLSYSFGRQYSDISVSMEQLAQEPSKQTQQILEAVGYPNMQELPDLSFVKTQASKWPDYASDQWFTDIEQECNELLEDFLK